MIEINLSNNEGNTQGVYGIFNNEYLRWDYIGQANNIYERIYSHLHHPKRYNDEFHVNFRKFPDNYSLYILETVEDENQLLDIEDFYVQKLKPKYVKMTKTGPHGKLMPLTDETKKKISISRKLYFVNETWKTYAPLF